MRNKEYFTTKPNDPPPLVASTTRTVRFEEVDMLKIMWHGNYPSYFEDARQVVGLKYNISYQDFINEQVAAPIRKLSIDYLHPLEFGKTYTITGRLHYTEAAKILYDFYIYAPDNTLCSSGYSIQMLVCAKSQELLLFPPPFIQNFLADWRAGKLI